MKFKVWDKTKRKWNKTGYFAMTGSGELIRIIQLEIGAPADDFTPVYSTGKTDKNGVELFEGDIVKFRHDGKNYTCFIEYSKGMYLLKPVNQTGLFWMLATSIIEKIGSKFENPELMVPK